jgi:hypothetical protein
MFWRNHWGLVVLALTIVPVVAIVVFAAWLRRRNDVDFEKGVKAWTAFVSLLSALTAIAAGVMVFAKYIEEKQETDRRAEQAEVKQRQLRQAELLRQSLTFDEQDYRIKEDRFAKASDAAARIGAAAGKPDPADVVLFNQLYFSGLIGVERLHGPVESAMVAFRDALTSQDGQDRADLGQLTIALRKACDAELDEAKQNILKQQRHIAELADEATKGSASASALPAAGASR